MTNYNYFLVGLATALATLFIIHLLMFLLKMNTITLDPNVPMGGTNDEMREYMYTHVTPGQGSFTYPPM